MTTIYQRKGVCIAALRPAYGDVVVTTTLRGKVAALDPVHDYDGAISRALELARRERGSPVKVLPMTLTEACFFCGFTPQELMADKTPEEWRAYCIRVCVPMLDDPDPRVRRDASDILTGMGVPH